MTIDEGPTSGTTRIPRRWQASTTSAPGSATPGHARFGNHARRTPLDERFHQLFDLTPGDGMFVQFAEAERVDRARRARFRQKPPRRAGILDDKIVERIHNGAVCCGQHVPRSRFVRDRTRDQIECSVHFFSSAIFRSNNPTRFVMRTYCTANQRLSAMAPTITRPGNPPRQSQLSRNPAIESVSGAFRTRKASAA